MIGDGFFPKSAEDFEVLCRPLGEGESLESGEGAGQWVCYISSRGLNLWLWERQLLLGIIFTLNDSVEVDLLIK